jgi:hypothetical protein
MKPRIKWNQLKKWDSSSGRNYDSIATASLSPEVKYLCYLAVSLNKWHPKNPERGRSWMCGLCEANDYDCRLCIITEKLESCIDRNEDDDESRNSTYCKARRELIRTNGQTSKYADMIYEVIEDEYLKFLSDVE